MDYAQLISYLKNLTNQGVNPSLKEIKLLCRELGSPQVNYPAIQVTGTNGKTSTSIMLASILTAHGLNCGLYISPHLIKYNERFSINDRRISDPEFVELAEKVMPAITRVNKKIQPCHLTEFEVLTGLACCYFAEKQVDVAIFEVGMGGRWDATSVVAPRVAVITSITKDHADYLGETLAEIASEKSYVIKNKTRAVSGRQAPEANEVLRKRALEQSGGIVFLGNDFRVQTERESGDLSVIGIFKNYSGLKLEVMGDFQQENAALAIVAAESYLNQELDNKQLSKSLLEVESPGRFSLLSRDPIIVFDGAHNLAGITGLVNEIKKQKFKRLILILSILRDKEVSKMLEILLSPTDLVFVTTNANQRALSIKELKELCARINSRLSGGKRCVIKEAPSVKDALAMAKAAANIDDLILLTGSLYGVGEGLAGRN